MPESTYFPRSVLISREISTGGVLNFWEISTGGVLISQEISTGGVPIFGEYLFSVTPAATIFRELSCDRLRVEGIIESLFQRK